MNIPEGVDWDIYRVATHERNRSGLHEIETLWSFDDLMLMNDMLDELEEAQARAQAPR